MVVRKLIVSRLDRAESYGFDEDASAFRQTDTGLKIIAEQIKNHFEGNNED